MVTPPVFAGDVKKARPYLLVDDHVGFGGTLANLRGYIIENGGIVVGMTTLTQSREAQKIALTQSTLSMLQSHHGEELETFWQKHFGYGLSCLTEIEGANLAREPSFERIRRRLLETADAAKHRDVLAVDFRSGSPEEINN
ncbi:MAG: hypothetical protein K2Q12_02430 [Rickettsiales bacterium]|nr:hypothetical protein [Rickettsiales bacterium]